MKHDIQKLEIIQFLYSIYPQNDSDPLSPIMIKSSLMKPLIYIISNYLLDVYQVYHLLQILNYLSKMYISITNNSYPNSDV